MLLMPQSWLKELGERSTAEASRGRVRWKTKVIFAGKKAYERGLNWFSCR